MTFRRGRYVFRVPICGRQIGIWIVSNLSKSVEAYGEFKLLNNNNDMSKLEVCPTGTASGTAFANFHFMYYNIVENAHCFPVVPFLS
jgi:hypothetical protein